MTGTFAILTCVGAVLIGFIGIKELLGWQLRQSEVRRNFRTMARSAIFQERPLILQKWIERIDNSSWSKSITPRLAQADLQLTPAQYSGILVLGWVLLFLACMLLFQPPLFISALLASALVWLGSRFFLNTRRDHYLTLLASQMPDTAILVSNSLKAGLSVIQAFEVVSEKMPRPTNVEFGRFVQQVQLGDPFAAAVEKMLARLPSEELGLMLTTISIQRKAGGDLAHALSVMSQAVSARRRVRNEIATLTAEARYTGLVLLVLPMVILVMLNQAMEGSVSKFLANPIGWVIITIFVAIQAVAFFWIERIAQVKV